MSGCRERAQPPRADAGSDSAPDVRPPLTLDIAVTGCGSYDAAVVRCSGPAPLVLSFSPVGSSEFTRFLWRFGDGTPVASDRAPVHSYTLPGSYEVTLIGAGDVGNIESRPVTVVAEAVGLGRPCDVDVQCESGLRCACTPGLGCPAAFVRGICTSACDTATCGPGGVCAMLGFGAAAPTDGSVPPASASCLAGCQTNAECATGFVCQTLPASTAGDDLWVRACLPLGALGDLGAPCRSASGALDDAICATRACADLGALGSCTAGCDAEHACPDTTACARLPDGRQLCLVDCASGPEVCGRDPLLACSAPAGGDGGTGYETDAAAGSTFCAPKSCADDSNCAPAGRCGPGARCVHN